MYIIKFITFILTLWQSCVLLTVVLINEYMNIWLLVFYEYCGLSCKYDILTDAFFTEGTKSSTDILFFLFPSFCMSVYIVALWCFKYSFVVILRVLLTYCACSLFQIIVFVAFLLPFWRTKFDFFIKNSAKSNTVTR